jgi:hypothetical protein
MKMVVGDDFLQLLWCNDNSKHPKTYIYIKNRNTFVKNFQNNTQVDMNSC